MRSESKKWGLVLVSGGQDQVLGRWTRRNEGDSIRRRIFKGISCIHQDQPILFRFLRIFFPPESTRVSFLLIQRRRFYYYLPRRVSSGWVAPRWWSCLNWRDSCESIFICFSRHTLFISVYLRYVVIVTWLLLNCCWANGWGKRKHSDDIFWKTCARYDGRSRRYLLYS